jgi:hypothetical protein
VNAGILQSTVGLGWETFSEDIGGIIAGDLITLIWGNSTGGGGDQAQIRNFRLYVLDYDAANVDVD